MPDYIQITFDGVTLDLSEVLIAQLSESGFEGFEEEEKKLTAFVPAASFNETLLKEIAEENNVSYSVAEIEETNWNQVWESGFKPIMVDHPVDKTPWVAIRASFHAPIKEAIHEIIITPKMSFGTGHHATTYMMVQQMALIDFTGKQVFDFGTGTGILAILADKLGSASVLAIDNDDWSIANAIENIGMNECVKTQIRKGDRIPGQSRYDIILANINKNVILDNFSSLISALSPDGILLLSGLLREDEKDILVAANQHNVKITKGFYQGEWCSLRINH